MDTWGTSTRVRQTDYYQGTSLSSMHHEISAAWKTAPNAQIELKCKADIDFGKWHLSLTRFLGMENAVLSLRGITSCIRAYLDKWRPLKTPGWKRADCTLGLYSMHLQPWMSTTGKLSQQLASQSHESASILFSHILKHQYHYNIQNSI